MKIAHAQLTTLLHRPGTTLIFLSVFTLLVEVGCNNRNISDVARPTRGIPASAIANTPQNDGADSPNAEDPFTNQDDEQEAHEPQAGREESEDTQNNDASEHDEENNNESENNPAPSPDDANNTEHGGDTENEQPPETDSPADSNSPPTGDSTAADGKSCYPTSTIHCEGQVSGNTNEAAPSNITLYSCATWWMSGPEIAYTFSTPTPQEVTASLRPTNGVNNLDLFLIENNGNGCHADSCLLRDGNELQWTAQANQEYYVVVDGFSEAYGTYDLTLTCSPAEEEAPPLANNACAPSFSLQCGQQFEADTAQAPPSNITLYSCATWWESGPEIAYSYTSPINQTVTASIIPLNGVNNLDLFLLEDTGDGCHSDSCLDFDGREITWNALAGVTYYLVVDGFSQAEGKYQFSLECGS